MKKFLVLTLTLWLVICSGLVFFGCESTQEPSHVCEFQTEWSFDETHHWHACKGEGCTLTEGKAEHAFTWIVDKEATTEAEGEKHEECSCGAKRNQGTVIDKLPQADINAVTEEEFYSALKFEGITSFSLDYYNLMLEYDDDLNVIGTQELDGEMFINANVGRYTYGEGWGDMDFNEIFIEVDGETTYEYVEVDEFGMVRMDVTAIIDDMGLLASPDFWEEGFIERSRVDFADFTYSDGKYIGVMKMDADNDTLVDVIFKFENAKLVFWRVDYEEEGYELYDEYEFYAYNQTTVILPTEFTDLGGFGGGGSNPSEWELYFEFDNVTISETIIYEYDCTYEGEPIDIPTNTVVSTLAIQDEKWLYQDGEDTIYYDGENAYLNGTVDADSADRDGVFLSWIYYLSLYEGLMIETSSGVYEAELLEGPYGYNYENLRIVITDGNIASISYEYTTEITDETSSDIIKRTYSYTFTNWGTTVVNPNAE